jgi:molybdopterin-guanine dinucleotide biosynthesis protein A
MGRDKALLEVAGETLAARALRRLSQVCEEVAMADNGRRLMAAARSLPDGAGRGPAAGILGAAAAYPGRQLLVLACDLPNVPLCVLSLLSPSTAGQVEADWVIPRWRGGLEPLCAQWGPAALAALAVQVERGDLALRSLAETSTLRIRYLEEPALSACGEPEEMFHNLNRPGDLERLISKADPPPLTPPLKG